MFKSLLHQELIMWFLILIMYIADQGAKERLLYIEEGLEGRN